CALPLLGLSPPDFFVVLVAISPRSPLFYNLTDNYTSQKALSQTGIILIMQKRLSVLDLLKADRLMLMVAAGLATALIINQVLSENARHRDSLRQADLYS